MKTTSLSEIFTAEQLRTLEKILKKPSKEELLSFLTEIKLDLDKIGIDHKFMYYALCNQFNIH